MSHSAPWALDGSLLNNREWTYARSPDGTQYRVISSFPWNPSFLPLFAVTSAIGSAILFLIIDAVLWPFSLLPYRTISVLDDGGMPIPGWGRCVLRKRRVPTSDVEGVVASIRSSIERGLL